MTYWKNHQNENLKVWQDKIENLSKSSTFCLLPWIHFATRPNGDMRLCCGANASGAQDDQSVGIVKDNNNKHINFGYKTPMEGWNSDWMKSVRLSMLDEHIPTSCKKCFEEESHGVSSKRVWETNWFIDNGTNISRLINETAKDGSVPEKISYLDLRLGHTCNLKCVMCSPHDSSRWVEEQKRIFPSLKDQNLIDHFKWDQKKFNNSWYENPEFWNQLNNQIPNLKQVYFAGGEPLMIKEHRIFIKRMIDSGYSKNITLRYSSNGVLIDEELIEMWEKFDQVRFAVSIDAEGDRNHYIRFPTEWEIIEKNLHRLDQTPDNIKITIATAIQMLNIKHLPDFIKWKVRSNFKKINQEIGLHNSMIGGGLINAHLLYIPTWFNIRVMPEDDKLDILERFKELKDWLKDNHNIDKDFWNKNPYGWRRWQGALDFMMKEDHTKYLPAFKEFIRSLDKSRNLNSKEIFPELAHLF